MLAPAALRGQPVRDRILGDVSVTRVGACVAVRIGLTFPIRYVKHFPIHQGEELRIHVQPISISAADRDALTERESIRPRTDDDSPLIEVFYEGDMAGGRFVTLLFRRPMVFEVGQGHDFRSLDVTLADPEGDTSCLREE